ncbi:CBS domain-containing protein [Methanoregula sp.]|uniref:CBS domain-containing protein n=1 Tax=Methanoregula sp. TaxID=2052170 RepID=UPI002370C601|nr:CBS domain-containing protein [Methanoregula sp.]MDD1687251.1 CBS domain-containing protein [Methanoregula sp.]
MEKAIEKILNEPVTAVMTACPLPVRPDMPLSVVFERFSHSNHPLTVVDADGTLAGVITPMDLISVLTPDEAPGGRHQISGLDRFLKSTAQDARDLMSDEPLTVPENAKIADALQAMEHGHSSSVILMNSMDQAVGCIELSDIIAYLVRSLPR